MSLSKPFEENNLQNASQYVKNSLNLPLGSSGRSAPLLPPRPTSNSLMPTNGYNSYNSFMPYSGVGAGSYNSYNSYMPYRNSPYNSYGSSYGSYGSGYGGGYNSYNSFGNHPTMDDHERRFIQYAEESSRNTFASVESIVRAFNSIAMMLDNTFFAMTSSFRAVLSVAENFGRLRTMFGHIWYSVNIFRFFTWLYRKFLRILGYKVPSSTASAAWRAAKTGLGEGGAPGAAGAPGSSWPTIAFLGVLVSAPYIISKFLPKYEDKGDPANWKSPGIRAKAVFDFIATAPNELTIQSNDLVILAPTYIQEEMNLKNSGWAFAVCKDQSGVVPLNYLVISKNRPIIQSSKTEEPPVPRIFPKTHTKRVSFGENQIFENVDLDDYELKKDSDKSSQEIKSVKKEEDKEDKTKKTAETSNDSTH